MSSLIVAAILIITISFSYGEYSNCIDPQLTIQHGEGICIMRGQSDFFNYQTRKHYPLYYNDPAIDARNDPNLNELLKDICPSYTSSPVCCDYQQALFLHEFTKFLNSMFKNCPACQHNFMTLFCGIWCDPNQSLFLKPKLMECSIYSTSQVFIKALNVSVASHLTDTLYNSCKDVKSLPICLNVIQMMCPESHPCNNSSQWLQFLGDPLLSYNYSPFFIHFNITNNTTDSISPLNTTVYNCNDVKSGLACSCIDCPSNLCNNLTIDHITLMSEDNFKVPMILLALSVVVVFVIIFGVLLYRFYKPVKLGHSLKKNSINQGDPKSEHIYYWYDYTVSNDPTTVILICLLQAGLLAVGHTDHIREIMGCSTLTGNDPTISRPSVQLIVTAPNFTCYNISLGGSDIGTWTFGPVFVREVLLEAFYLQRNITTSSGSVTYSDICYKPDGINCMINSIFEYFQNSIDNLLYVETDGFGVPTFNASYHVHYCIRYPASTHDKYPWGKDMSCVTSFHGIVEATNVLAGYANYTCSNRTLFRYETASQLLMTFVFDPSADTTQWMSNFKDFLQHFSSSIIKVTLNNHTSYKESEWNIENYYMLTIVFVLSLLHGVRATIYNCIISIHCKYIVISGLTGLIALFASTGCLGSLQYTLCCGISGILLMSIVAIDLGCVLIASIKKIKQVEGTGLSNTLVIGHALSQVGIETLCLALVVVSSMFPIWMITNDTIMISYSLFIAISYPMIVVTQMSLFLAVVIKYFPVK